MLIDINNDTDLQVLKNQVRNIQGLDTRLQKIASFETASPDDLSPEAFAWPEEKMYPIYSPEAALVSSVYLEGNGSVPEFVKEACVNACEVFGFEVKLDSLEKVAEEKIEQLSDSDFILPTRRKLPAVDQDSFRVSKNIFVKAASDLSLEDVVIGANQIIKLAEALGETFEPDIKVLALRGGVETNTAKNILHDRLLETSDHEYLKIAESLPDGTLRNQKAVANLLYDIISLDHKNKLEKTAAETIASISTFVSDSNFLVVDNQEFDLEKIASIDPEDWLDVFPRDVVESLFAQDNAETVDFQLLSTLEKTASAEEKEALSYFLKTRI